MLLVFHGPNGYETNLEKLYTIVMFDILHFIGVLLFLVHNCVWLCRRRHFIFYCECSILCLFFILLTPVFFQNLHSLLLAGNERDRTETLTQCVEWSQFALEHFYSEI